MRLRQLLLSSDGESFESGRRSTTVLDMVIEGFSTAADASQYLSVTSSSIKASKSSSSMPFGDLVGHRGFQQVLDNAELYGHPDVERLCCAMAATFRFRGWRWWRRGWSTGRQ